MSIKIFELKEITRAVIERKQAEAFAKRVEDARLAREAEVAYLNRYKEAGEQLVKNILSKAYDAALEGRNSVEGCQIPSDMIVFPSRDSYLSMCVSGCSSYDVLDTTFELKEDYLVARAILRAEGYKVEVKNRSAVAFGMSLEPRPDPQYVMMVSW